MSAKFLKAEFFFAYFCRSIKTKNISKKGGGASGKESKPTGSPHFTTAKTWLMNKLVVAENGMSPAKVFALQGIKLFYSRGAGATPCRYFYLARGYIKGYFWRAPFSLSLQQQHRRHHHALYGRVKKAGALSAQPLVCEPEIRTECLLLNFFQPAARIFVWKNCPSLSTAAGTINFAPLCTGKIPTRVGHLSQNWGPIKQNELLEGEGGVPLLPKWRIIQTERVRGSSNLFAYLISLAAALYLKFIPSH